MATATPELGLEREAYWSQLTPEQEAARRAAVVDGRAEGPPPPPTGAGAVADVLLLPVHVAAALVGVASQEIGRAAGWDDLVDAGRTLVMGDKQLSAAVGEKPLAAVQVAAGSVLVATGIATSAGAGLIANGARELAGVMFHDKGRADVSGGALPGTPDGELERLAAVQERPRPRAGVFARFAAWFRSLFGGDR